VGRARGAQPLRRRRVLLPDPADLRRRTDLAQRGRLLAFPPPGWSLKWYASYFSQPQWLQATLLSFQVAVVTMLTSTVLGTLAAYGVLRGRLRRRALLVSLIISPIIVPPIVIGVAIYGLLAQWDLIGRFLGLVIGHAIGSIAYVVVIVSATLAASTALWSAPP